MSQVHFEVVSHNVNGLGDDRKRRKIFNFMRKHISSKKASVCLQETHSTPKNENYSNISGEAKFYSPMELQAAKGYVYVSDTK